MNIEEILRVVCSVTMPGQSVYLVGGSVRDRVLGRAAHDLDFTLEGRTRSTAQTVADRLGGGFYPLDEERGTYRVVLSQADERLVLDFASLRGQTLEEDLRARDFTINAMAVELSNPARIIDPLGGQADLAAHLLRACTPTSVAHDPVRALRAVRLAHALQLELEAETLAQVRAGTAMLGRISAERLRDEFFRILEGPRSIEAIRTLDQLGLLGVLLPDLAGLKGMVQSPPHVWMGWEHTLAVVERLEQVLALLAGEPGDDLPAAISAAALAVLGHYRAEFARHLENYIAPERSRRAMLLFAALYHDCAKPLTRTIDAEGRIRYFNHDHLGAEVTAARARALALSGPEADWLELMVGGHMRVHHLADSPQRPARRTVYRYFRDTKAAAVDICLLSLADTWATYGPTLPLEQWQDELEICRILLQAGWEQPEAVVSPPRLIGGDDLIRELGMKPGQLIGRVLEAVHEGQAAGEIGSREDALALARQMLAAS